MIYEASRIDPEEWLSDEEKEDAIHMLDWNIGK